MYIIHTYIIFMDRLFILYSFDISISKYLSFLQYWLRKESTLFETQPYIESKSSYQTILQIKKDRTSEIFFASLCPVMARRFS